MSPAAPAPTPPGDESRRSVLGRERAYRRTLAWAVGVSAVLHVLAVAAYPRLFGGLPEVVLPGQSSASGSVSGIQVVNLVEVSSRLLAPTDPTPLPRALEEPAAPEPTVVAPEEPAQGAVRPPVPGPGDAMSAAERLQPRSNEPRLWARLPPEITNLSLEQRARNLLYARLEVLNDSAAASAERARRATDWTFTDGEGNKWGVSPGKLHLGPVTLPLPFMFGLPAGASDDLRRAQAQDAEIRRAAGQAAADETAKERAAAIRKRKDEERKRTKPDTTGGGGGGR